MTTPVDLTALRSSFPPGDPDAAEFIAVLDALDVAIEALGGEADQVGECEQWSPPATCILSASDHPEYWCAFCRISSALAAIAALVTLVTPEGETR